LGTKGTVRGEGEHLRSWSRTLLGQELIVGMREFGKILIFVDDSSVALCVVTIAWIRSGGNSNCSAMSEMLMPKAKLSTIALAGMRVARNPGAMHGGARSDAES
jgi:hypothetical protein